MKIVEITVSKSMKINTGNYESKDYFVSMKAEIDITENSGTVVKALFENVSLCLQEEIANDR